VKESERIQALRGLNVLDTPPEERFDRLTRLARRLFDVPIALVSLVDEKRQWFLSKEGVVAKETPREWSFCSVAIETGERLVLPDALEDPRFRQNPLVTEDPSIRFYAGQPIRAPGGAFVGTLCIIDREPRELSDEDQSLLADMAAMVEHEFATHRMATIDELTGLSNRRGFNMLAKQALAFCIRVGRPATLLAFDLNGFKAINDTLGHAAGDAALQSFSAELMANYRDSDVLARVGGDEFCVLLSGTTAAEAPLALNHLAERVGRRNEGRDDLAHIRYSVGTAEFDPERHTTIADLVLEEDELMYVDKRSQG